MTETFKAIVLNQTKEKFSREIKTLDKSFFKSGDVLVKVEYSSLNYKDALILKNGARLVKEYPHIPGVDFSGNHFLLQYALNISTISYKVKMN